MRSLAAVPSSSWSVQATLAAATKGQVGVRASRPVTPHYDHVGIRASRSVKHINSSSFLLLFVSFRARPPTTRFRPLLVFMYALAHFATGSYNAFVFVLLTQCGARGEQNLMQLTNFLINTALSFQAGVATASGAAPARLVCPCSAYSFTFHRLHVGPATSVP